MLELELFDIHTNRTLIVKSLKKEFYIYFCSFFLIRTNHGYENVTKYGIGQLEL